MGGTTEMQRKVATAGPAAPPAVEYFDPRPACLVCGETERKTVISLAFHEPQVGDFLRTYYRGRIPWEIMEVGRFEVARCKACGFLWQASCLKDGWMGELYGSWISAKESREKRENADVSLYDEYARDVRNIAPSLGRRPHAIRVLDFGMGWGYWCLMAKAFGYRVAGCELSEERMEFARANGIEVLSGLEAMQGRQFDYINASQVFEHVTDPAALLKTLVGSLAPDGIMSIQVPDGRGMGRKVAKKGWKAAADALHPLEHINCFTNSTLIALAAGAGLRPVVPRRTGLLPRLRGIAGRYLSTNLQFRKA